MSLLDKRPSNTVPYVAVAIVSCMAGALVGSLNMGSENTPTFLATTPITTMTKPATLPYATTIPAPRLNNPATRLAASQYINGEDVALPESEEGLMFVEGPNVQSKVPNTLLAAIAAAVASVGAGIAGYVSKKRNLAKEMATGAAAAAVTLSTVGAAHAYQAPAPALFAKACAACHIAGGNLVIKGHTLSRSAMEKYLDGGWTKDAIEYQIRNGKGPMPAWEGILSEGDIAALRDYVYAQSTGEWVDVDE
uniref:Cytochrome c-553 n=1 Tax=Eutreptiella gymnastica TaxID=73025 RepID=A0A7S1IDR8_9EUGL|mmetsp:Transcript_148637/g.259772  ORF Transcript_148637/g.259772 Transcript_148637/m.259772 type:complete len:250 (+) Transcript_148637:125-874(+)